MIPTRASKKSIGRIADKGIELLEKELEGQGHKDTGKLIKSLQYETLEKSNAIELIYSYLIYGKFINDSVPPQKVRYGIQIMIDYLKRKGVIKSKKDNWIAYATRNKHRKEGIPTKASWKFSKNGRRTGFQDHVFKELSAELAPLIDEEIINPLILLFYDIIKGEYVK